jgi:dihydropteroate synthase
MTKKIPLMIDNNLFNWGEKTYLMGILNITPDSFSDGGEFNNLDRALLQGKMMVENGANILDIGGQSTRPGSVQVSLEEELNRVIPVVKILRKELSIPISIDTTRAIVAQKAVEAGANIVNDISAGMFDKNMFSTVAKLNVPYILMHIKGTPETMQNFTQYADLISEIYQFFEEKINLAVAAGIKRNKIIIDPGIGFAKTYQQNILILQQLATFQSLNLPILIGLSRKSFIGHILHKNDPKERIWGTAGACCGAIASGADILRVHDVPQMYDVCRVGDQIWRNA